MDATETGIYAREMPGISRVVRIGIASGNVISLSMPEEPDGEASPDHALLDRLEAYFSGEPDDFSDVSIALTVPTDHRAVLERVRELPYGETIDVETLAGMVPDLDAEEDLDVVRTALAENPVPVFIPGHRVGDGPNVIPDRVAHALRSLEGDE